MRNLIHFDRSTLKNVLIIALVLACLCFPNLVAADDRLDAITKQVDQHYNRLNSLQAEFTETYRGAGMFRSESGTLILKRPGRMRWEYEQPRKKLFIVNRATAWFYVPGDRQARKVSVKTMDDLRTPLAYLLGKTKLQKEFEGLSLAPDIAPINPGNIVLRGIPKRMGERVSQVILEVTPGGAIERIFAEELDGSTTEFRFRNQKANVPVLESRFAFSLPPGVEVIKANELAQ